ncbi:MAG: ABC transporter permease [Oscillospiraceae bacterium]|jgi:putative ABC transport system permease protein|nr:ABC transporter permease [Oscillospiraceae bacterium]
MIDILVCSARNIGRKKIRSFLTAVGVAIGVASVVLIGNISKSGSYTILNELDSLGFGGLTVSANTRSMGIERKQLNNQHLDAVRKSAYVKQAMPLITRSAEISSHNLQAPGVVFGVNEKASQIISLKILYGRPITKSDVASNRNVCIVDQKFSQKFYSRNNMVGKKISITLNSMSEIYEVIGVAKTGNGLLDGLVGNYIPDFVYIPYSSVQNATGTKTFDQIAIKVSEDSKLSIGEIGLKIVDLLKKDCTMYDEYVINNLSKQKDELVKLFDVVTVILSAVGGVSLLVASLSVMIVMLVSVSERTREIGIKKSIGASRFSIMTEFLIEGMTITIVGGVCGVIMGNLIFWLGSLILNFHFTIKIDSTLLGFLFSVVTGVIFGIYPAAKASKMRPVDALRY